MIIRMVTAAGPQLTPSRCGLPTGLFKMAVIFTDIFENSQNDTHSTIYIFFIGFKRIKEEEGIHCLVKLDFQTSEISSVCYFIYVFVTAFIIEISAIKCPIYLSFFVTVVADKVNADKHVYSIVDIILEMSRKCSRNISYYVSVVFILSRNCLRKYYGCHKIKRWQNLIVFRHNKSLCKISM